MSTRHDKILARILQRPPPANMRWQDLINTLKRHGVEVSEREGSRVGLRKGSERIVAHRPHPGSIAGRETIRDIANFLAAAGVVSPVASTNPQLPRLPMPLSQGSSRKLLDRRRK